VIVPFSWAEIAIGREAGVKCECRFVNLGFADARPRHHRLELRLLAAVRWSIREHGGEPSSRQVDELLDERLSHLRGASEDAAVGT
jgi:hypothetical protein